MRAIRFYAPFLFALVATGCDSVGNQQLDTVFVVESILVAGQPLPPLLLSRVGDIDEKYLFEAHAEPGAQVTVLVTGAVANETVRYQELIDVPGVYIPRNYDYPVLPLHQYDLTIQPATSTQPITASTVVPDTFSIASVSQTEVIYQSSNQLRFRITPSHYPGRDQSYFIFVTEAVDAFESNLVPFAKERFDDGDGESLEELRVNPSPIINEDNYEFNDDGTLNLRYPWVGINFFGPNIVHVNVLDDNLYNFERSRAVQEGGSTFAPGEIPNPLPHVNGAHGLFGSQARVSAQFTVIRP